MKSISFVSSLALAGLLGSTLCFADAGALAKEADKIIRNAERQMFSGKNEEASSALEKARTLLDQAKSENPKDKRLILTEKKYDRIKKSVDRKLAAKASAAQHTPVSPGASHASPSKKVPGGVTRRLDNVNKLCDRAEGGQTYVLEEARRTFDEIESMYGKNFDLTNAAYVQTKQRLESLEQRDAAADQARAAAAADAQSAKAAMEAQSAEWIPRFQAYLSYPGIEGHDPEKLVFIPGTSEEDKFAEAKKRYEAFKRFYEAYQKVDFPHGRNWKLQDLADNQAPMRIADFEKGFASRLDTAQGDVGKEIASAMRQLEKETGWKSDKSMKPPLVDRNWMARIKEQVERASKALESEPAKAAQLRGEFDALVAKEMQNREIRKERTFMTPDRYAGPDIDAIKHKAVSLVKEHKKEGGTPLRTTVISKNWQETSGWEWTDTAHTKRVFKTTRGVSAQVAAKTADGVRLITVAVEMEKQSNGEWGPMYGNLHQYSDPMLEKNVFIDAP